MGLAFDELNNGRLELKKGFQELSTQIKGTNHCITAMTAGVAFQAGEVTKLLKAFDRWANTSRWAMAGSQTIETNIKGVQGEIEKQAERLGASMNGGLETLGGHIQELVNLLRAQPHGTAIPAGIPVSEGAAETGTPLTPGAIGCSGSWRSSDWRTPGSTGTCGIHQFRRSAIASTDHQLRRSALPGTGSTSLGEVPMPGSAPGAHVNTPLPPPALPVSLLMAFCPEQPEWAETKYSPSDPNTVPACGHRYQRCGNGGTEDIVTDAYRPEQIGGITSLWAPKDWE